MYFLLKLVSFALIFCAFVSNATCCMPIKIPFITYAENVMNLHIHLTWYMQKYYMHIMYDALYKYFYSRFYTKTASRYPLRQHVGTDRVRKGQFAKYLNAGRATLLNLVQFA